MAVVVLAMSGGVDSSVAAHLLRQNGHDVVGVFMRHGTPSESTCASPHDHPLPILDSAEGNLHKQGCCTASDAEDARQVADRLGVDFYALNLQRDFDRIIDYFVNEYAQGRTPNPCVMCNHWIKFGRLFDYADSIGADFVATGHYARLGVCDHETGLFRGRDRDKDQSYVLFGVDRRLLPRMMLPIGEYTKPEIRAIARQIGLDVANKRDSQEICFVSPGRHAEFVAKRSGTRNRVGEMVTADGRVVGRHEGIERFTIGQRKGLGVALGEPYYVVQIDADSNRVILGPYSELARSTLFANRTNWLIDSPVEWTPGTAQIRYNSEAVPALFRCVDKENLEVRFEHPCFGVAPGQAVVCFDRDRVLGGGWIQSTA